MTSMDMSYASDRLEYLCAVLKLIGNNGVVNAAAMNSELVHPPLKIQELFFDRTLEEIRANKEPLYVKFVSCYQNGTWTDAIQTNEGSSVREEEAVENLISALSSRDRGLLNHFDGVVADSKSPDTANLVRFCVKSFLGKKDYSSSFSQDEDDAFRLEFRRMTAKEKQDENYEIPRLMRLLFAGAQRYKFRLLEHSDRNFERFLRTIDSNLPEILAAMMGFLFLQRKTFEKMSFSDLAAALVNTNLSPEIQKLGNTKRLRKISLEYKLKKFLIAWLGWDPNSTEFSLLEDYQGLIFVNEDGGLIMPCAVGSEKIKNYLLHNAYLQRPVLLKESRLSDGTLTVRLSSQIHFRV